MVQYFKVAGAVGKFIQYDDVTNYAQVIIKANLLQQRDELIARIAVGDPNKPTTNAEWVAWGKANYKGVDYTAEQAELDRILVIIEAIKAL